MHTEIKELIKLTIATGEITEKKRSTIMRKAGILGEDLDEVELILNGEFVIYNQGSGNISQTYTPINTSNKKEVDVNFFQGLKSFYTQNKLLKFSGIFFLLCLIFFFFCILMVALIYFG